MSEVQEVLGREPGPGPVVGMDRWQVDIGRGGVDQDHGERRRREPFGVAAAQAAGRDDQAVDAALDQEIEIARLPFGVVGGVAQQDRVALGASRVLDRPDELGEIRVLDVGDDQPKGLGRLPLERTRNARGPVVELASRRKHARLGLGPRPTDPGQDAADGRGRDVRPLGDVADGSGHVQIPRARRFRRRRRPGFRPDRHRRDVLAAGLAPGQDLEVGLELLELGAAAHQPMELVGVELATLERAARAAAREDRERVADRQRVLDVVGDEDHTESLVAGGDGVTEDDGRFLDAERRRRFVEDQDAGTEVLGAGDGQRLPFAARQRPDELVGVADRRSRCSSSPRGRSSLPFRCRTA